jgi:site-specific DNA recombinase
LLQIQYTVQSENDIIPLKRFLKCNECGSYLRGYKAYKNQKYYYKCNTPGCKCNKRADSLHETFRELLAGFTLDVNEDYRQIIKTQVIATYNQYIRESRDKEKMLEERMGEVDKKIKRLRERHANEEIDRDLYEEFTTKLIGERKATAEELGKMGNEVSNLDKCVDEIINYASNLATTWDLAAYAEKQQLQFLLFPEGMSYNRKNDQCRTSRVNEVFLDIAQQAGNLPQNKNGDNTFVLSPSVLVPRTGVEPVIPP